MTTQALRVDVARKLAGVPGRLLAVAIGGQEDRWISQQWISEARPVKGYGRDATMRVTARYDDSCRNGHNSFGLTAEIRRPGARDVEACGCLHDEIEKVFPELSGLIKWHLTSSDGPMHYIANTVYLASDRDHWGLRKGEKRPLINGRTKLPVWELVAVTGGPKGLGVKISDTPTGREHIGAETVPLYVLVKDHDGEEPPATPVLEWRRKMITGEGKERQLDAARRAAVWPEATDEQLCASKEELTAALEARLPAILAAFKSDLVGAGLIWSPSEFNAEDAQWLTGN